MKTDPSLVRAADLDFREAVSALKPQTQLMGLDLGTKTIGIALSDRLRKIATPLLTLTRSKFSIDCAEILRLIKTENVGLIVLGLPINMDGSEGPRAQATRAFARNFALHSPLSVVFWDERLSTQAVERILIEADLSRRKRDRVIDKLAAAYILQAALDSLQY